MDIQYTIIGNRIKLRRKELHLKQGELAERLDISNNHMSSIENGREHPSLEVLLSICDILKVTPDYLLMGCMHTNDIPQDVVDGLRLCREENILLIKEIIKYLIERNQKNWNENNCL